MPSHRAPGRETGRFEGTVDKTTKGESGEGIEEEGAPARGGTEEDPAVEGCVCGERNISS